MQRKNMHSLLLIFVTTLVVRTTSMEPEAKRRKIEHGTDQQPSWITPYQSRLQKSKLIEENISHPLLQDNNMELLFDLAVKTKSHITQQYSQENQVHIFSLGQAAAWLIAMMEKIDQVKNRHNTQYGLIAFSSHFFECDTNAQILVKDSCKYPDTKKQKAYSNYLKTIFPSSTNTHTAIIEFPFYTRGLYSFYDVAKNSLPSKHTFLITPPRSTMTITPEMMPPNTEILSFAENNNPFIASLANSDNFDDRRVLHFPTAKWGNDNPLAFKVSESCQLLHTIMSCFVEQRLKKPILKVIR